MKDWSKCSYVDCSFRMREQSEGMKGHSSTLSSKRERKSGIMQGLHVAFVEFFYAE